MSSAKAPETTETYIIDASSDPDVKLTLIDDRTGERHHVVDFADEDDPGWSIPETSYDGTETCSDVRQFLQGVPNFVVQVTDADGIVTRVIVLMQIDQSVPGTSVTWGAVKARF